MRRTGGRLLRGLTTSGLVVAIAVGGPADTAIAVEPPVIIHFPVAADRADFKNDFGIHHRERVHRGIDIFAGKGTPVIAVADGFVVKRRRAARPGYYLVLRHADGWTSWYLHLDNDSPGTDDGRGGEERAFAEGLEVGDYVAAGEVIGYLGDSGNAEKTPPHVHFELRRRNRARNPHAELEAAWEREQTIRRLADTLR